MTAIGLFGGALSFMEGLMVIVVKLNSSGLIILIGLMWFWVFFKKLLKIMVYFRE